MKLWETWELYQSKQCNKNSYDVSRVSLDDNGLYYMRARYYNVSIKRFINQDVVTGNMAESQSLNRYAYVEGNPVSYLDPFGLEKVDTSGMHLVAGVVGAAGIAVSDTSSNIHINVVNGLNRGFNGYNALTSTIGLGRFILNYINKKLDEYWEEKKSEYRKNKRNNY